jgi:hypothetical protein
MCAPSIGKSHPRISDLQIEGATRPLGNKDFVEDLERRLKRPLARRGAGRKPLERPEEQSNLL